MRASIKREGDRLLIRSGAGRVVAEIDLLNAVIKTLVPGIILQRFRTHALREYTSVALQECIRSIEEGYLVAEYTIFLQGARTCLNILSTYNRKEALTFQKELCMMLSLPCKGLQRAEDTVVRVANPGQSD